MATEKTTTEPRIFTVKDDEGSPIGKFRVPHDATPEQIRKAAAKAKQHFILKRQEQERNRTEPSIGHTVCSICRHKIPSGLTFNLHVRECSKKNLGVKLDE